MWLTCVNVIPSVGECVWRAYRSLIPFSACLSESFKSAFRRLSPPVPPPPATDFKVPYLCRKFETTWNFHVNLNMLVLLWNVERKYLHSTHTSSFVSTFTRDSEKFVRGRIVDVYIHWNKLCFWFPFQNILLELWFSSNKNIIWLITKIDYCFFIRELW